MKSSHLLTLAIAIATVGLSLPARADNATTNESVQTVIVTGSNNSVNQSNNTSVQNRDRRNGDNTGTAVRTRQNADILGDGNTVNQSNQTRVGYSRYRNR